MSENQKKKKFLKYPKYIGGSEAFRDFIVKNLQYPKAAIEAKVEGSVFVEYEINDNGIVQNPRILKGIGHGCDEEAMRVVSLLRFEKVRNRGVRVTTTTKTTIHFKLPKVNFTYSVEKKTEPEKPKEKQEPGQVVYNYTINL